MDKERTELARELEAAQGHAPADLLAAQFRVDGRQVLLLLPGAQERRGRAVRDGPRRPGGPRPAEGRHGSSPGVGRARGGRAPAWKLVCALCHVGGVCSLFFSGLLPLVLGGRCGRSARCRASVDLGFEGTRCVVLAS